MNRKKKVMLVFGTRPEAIKMAPLYHALRRYGADFETLTCVTAQHRQMLDQVLQTFDITPDIDLNLMKPGQDLFDVTAAVLLAMRDVIQRERPDVLLIHGDTTTTLATAIAGFYAGVPVGHVEAGLRTHDLSAPFPEEFNRQVASKLTRWHFAPTAVSRQNLLDERVPDDRITITGNTVIDALMWVLARIDGDAGRQAQVCELLDERLPFNWRTKRFVLITGHRRENFGDGFLQICEALRELAVAYPGVHFVYPVHLNPNVQQPVNDILSGLVNLHLVAPIDYEPFVYLLKHAHLVLTDSGGIQEEAPSLGKPVLVMRDVTERPEAVAAGTVRLVGAHRQRIVDNVRELLDSEAAYQSMARAHNPYGDGQACGRIVDLLKEI
ncbi:non-hydrolyzing UDP-N-acetylglucosamine 2-epimerase [Paucibacter sp. KCTC 42545]|uniref:non-hydrolyzing UDP-N-acetylglucosamine 2-epimerase n=1 Tax=Paucibacter sp. KCTC 42545 TaxID=1768242 RepID=UPI000733B416|nr:UDP-N-acetylglucosamine 2-epimerase (non-hydrolyzing) [Paucibacter sp. KCTC 42545]ALT76181.1 UDP-N-acetyl glucosamine 2-epimerase [Paucibacter sp. KCTC 42545]